MNFILSITWAKFSQMKEKHRRCDYARKAVTLCILEHDLPERDCFSDVIYCNCKMAECGEKEYDIVTSVTHGFLCVCIPVEATGWRCVFFYHSWPYFTGSLTLAEFGDRWLDRLATELLKTLLPPLSPGSEVGDTRSMPYCVVVGVGAADWHQVFMLVERWFYWVVPPAPVVLILNPGQNNLALAVLIAAHRQWKVFLFWHTWQRKQLCIHTYIYIYS